MFTFIVTIKLSMIRIGSEWLSFFLYLSKSVSFGMCDGAVSFVLSLQGHRRAER